MKVKDVVKMLDYNTQMPVCLQELGASVSRRLSFEDCTSGEYPENNKTVAIIQPTKDALLIKYRRDK